MRTQVILTTVWITFASIAVFAADPLDREAQEPVSSLVALPLSGLAKGDQIRVTTRDGKAIVGEFEGISGNSLRLAAHHVQQERLESSIGSIQKRTSARKSNALLGIGIGLAVGIAITPAVCTHIYG